MTHLAPPALTRRLHIDLLRVTTCACRPWTPASEQ
ncbi:putative leader peptide [Intrasporangium sp.]